MRERHQKIMALDLEIGITPAYAGKTLFPNVETMCILDHPRVCGKDACPLCFCLGVAGSPPRMRERLNFHQYLSFRTGITPAYAGKTFLTLSAFQLVWDHPRVCGKDSCYFFLQWLNSGSPPRMRERHYLHRV